ncbi:hypothetical protein ACJIZ3_018898 [Penstemon smallii]|uniref:Uncharacterized protein n=1 Tax=Penstemon smallii TaxID=265156 RepID=A0ABD3T0H9_9LAMI
MHSSASCIEAKFRTATMKPCMYDIQWISPVPHCRSKQACLRFQYVAWISHLIEACAYAIKGLVRNTRDNQQSQGSFMNLCYSNNEVSETQNAPINDVLPTERRKYWLALINRTPRGGVGGFNFSYGCIVFTRFITGCHYYAEFCNSVRILKTTPGGSQLLVYWIFTFSVLPYDPIKKMFA